MSNDDPSSKTIPRVDKVVPVGSTKWLALETYHWTDEEGKQRLWDVATRTTKPKIQTAEDDDDDVDTDIPGNTRSEADAVIVIPLLAKPNDPNDTSMDTILVEQYRPPVRSMTMEFPAGLVDAGETVEQAALRELREETGYVGTFCGQVPEVSRPVNMSPGMSTETVHVVIVHVDLDNPYNQNPKTELEDGEHVKVSRVPLNEGIKVLLDQCPSMPIMGLYMFALGFQLGKEQGKKESSKS